MDSTFGWLLGFFLLGKYFITIHGSGVGFWKLCSDLQGLSQPDLLRGRSNDHHGYLPLTGMILQVATLPKTLPKTNLVGGFNPTEKY